jgi:hypothetical protein
VKLRSILDQSNQAFYGSSPLPGLPKSTLQFSWYGTLVLTTAKREHRGKHRKMKISGRVSPSTAWRLRTFCRSAVARTRSRRC